MEEGGRMSSDERITELERELIDVRIRLSRLERELQRLSSEGRLPSEGAPTDDVRPRSHPPRVPWLRAVDGSEENDAPEM
jgi:hypothetical protein